MAVVLNVSVTLTELGVLDWEYRQLRRSVKPFLRSRDFTIAFADGLPEVVQIVAITWEPTSQTCNRD